MAPTTKRGACLAFGSRAGTWIGVALGLWALLHHPGAAAGQTLRVGPAGEYREIGSAVARAGAGDTIRVEAGTYHERLTIHQPVVLIGEGWPIIDGQGGGHVVEATAPLELQGFVIRASGTGVDEEHAGVMVRGAPARILNNRIEDVLYGIYLKDAGGSYVRDNRIEGKPLPYPRRGDGIRLWYSSGSEITGNHVTVTRDVVVYFSDSLLVSDNVVTAGRYGLHYMYSDHNRFERNLFVGNQVGAFLMYSRDIQLRDNVFAEAEGDLGMGLGLKDADEIRAVNNLFVQNVLGIYLDNSPSGTEVTNSFTGNLILFNQTGVRLLPSVRGNEFVDNSFMGNVRPVGVSGGSAPGQVFQNAWDGNYWTEYAGFDRDRDGVGDTPFVHARLADDLMSRYPDFQLFSLSPALRLVDALSHFFPLLRPEPVVVDSTPLLNSHAPERWRAARAESTVRAADGGPRASAGLMWLGLLVLSMTALWKGTRL